MVRRPRLVLIVSAVLLCAVGGSVAAAASLSAKRATPALIKVKVAKKINRNIVVSSKGLTLYLFTADTGGTSACTDPACKKLWPPLLTTGAPVAGKGINRGLLGTIQRPDGTQQVTYNKHPLYFFHGGSGYGARDRLPGQLHGQGLFSAWWVLSPKGAAIHKRPR
jgi:predicted lipoprotein with Yx(FWY)xxD motif